MCDRLWWAERHRKHDLLQLFFDKPLANYLINR